MNILIIGSGGREHALAWKISQSEKVKKIYAAPGNGGMVPTCERVDIKADDLDGLLAFAKENSVDLTIVGPEAPLAEGIVDKFEKEGLKIFGPSKAASEIESSKAFAKEFMKKNKIPTADFVIFDDMEKAKAYVEGMDDPLVIKADGLAAGKGVIPCRNKEAALKALDTIMGEKTFGDAGDKVIIEEYMDGEEASMLVLTDGKNFLSMPSSQDHKRAKDNDEGPNTGGMGAYSPAPVVTDEMEQKIIETIIKPTIEGMEKDKKPYRGVLYVGLMIRRGEPYVIEYNCRFGDPELQAVLPRLETDLLDAIEACIDGTLDKVEWSWDPKMCICVVLASNGYPGEYETGKVIRGLEDIEGLSDVLVFHAGTDMVEDNLVSSGGRVMNIVGMGYTVEETLSKVYEGVTIVDFDNKFFRTDIAHRALVAGGQK